MAAATQAEAKAPQPIDEGLFVNINGVQQWITIRGRDRRNPVLLWLHGGPGFPMSGMAPMFFDWENDFTIVQWDQVGGGATFVKNIGVDIGPLTAERYIGDAISVVEFLRKHLGVRRVVLMGVSWGTRIGVQVAHRRPDLVSAYVGTGQVVSTARGNLLGYQLGLEAARRRGDAAAVAALEKVGPPPYATFDEWLIRQQYTNPPAVPPSPQAQAAMAELGKVMATPPPPDAHYVAKGLPPYDFIGQFLALQRAFYPEMAGYEAESAGLTFKVPVFIFQGDADMNTPTALAREYFDKISAPAKAFELIPGAEHNTTIFHAELLRLLRLHVLPLVRAKAA